MLQHRLDWAKRYLDDARSLCEQKRFNSAVSRAARGKTICAQTIICLQSSK